MAMKRCKECGTEISTGAKVCPKCGKNQQNFFQRHIFLTIILVLIIFGSIVGTSNTGSNISSNLGDEISIQNEKITLEKFNQIQTGMTYEEVVEIIGEEGTVMSDVDIGSSEYKTTMYCWYAKNGISNANVTIQGGKVVSKAQVGLQ